jgi:hypothetical protein
VTDEPTLTRLLSNAGVKFLLCATEAEADRAVRCMRGAPHLSQLILQHGRVRNPSVVRLDLLLRSGDVLLADKPHELEKRAADTTPTDTAVIAFSTGTMGLPRLVRMSHERLHESVDSVTALLGPGPALYTAGRFDLVDHAVLLWAGMRAGREIAFGEPPPRPWEWVAAAPELADSLFSLTWPVVEPHALPRGFRRWRMYRQVVRNLRAVFPHFRGAHTGFSVPSAPIVEELRRAGLRLTWGYGFTEAHGFCTWEESGRGFGSVLPHARLGTHQGGLAFDWVQRSSNWWQASGDWARTVGPWIQDLEPHGIERGEPQALHTARKIERELEGHPWVAKVFVGGPESIGDVALLTLRTEPVYAWARTVGLDDASWDNLLEHPRIADPLMARARAVGHRHGATLRPVILKRRFMEESGEVTARGEFRRSLLARRAAEMSQPPRPNDGH